MFWKLTSFHLDPIDVIVSFAGNFSLKRSAYLVERGQMITRRHQKRLIDTRVIQIVRYCRYQGSHNLEIGQVRLNLKIYSPVIPRCRKERDCIIRSPRARRAQRICTYLLFLKEAMHRLSDVSRVYTVVVRICTMITLLDKSCN